MVSLSIAQPPGMYTDGRYLYDRCGEQVVLRGVNEMVTWMSRNGYTFPEMAQTGMNCVRIVLITSDSASDMDQWITQCVANQMIPMVEQHSATGNFGALQAMVDWWVQPDVVNVIQQHEEYLIVNIANECGDFNVDQNTYTNEYTTAMNRMRQAGIHTPLVIDAPGWGLNVDVLKASAPTLYQNDPDHNVIFSSHFYGKNTWGVYMSSGQDQWLRDQMDHWVNANLPYIWGELAKWLQECVCCGDTDTLFQYAQEKQIGWLVWNWGPGNLDCNLMEMSNDGYYNNMTDWGMEVVVNHPYGIMNTSVRPQSMINGYCTGQLEQPIINTAEILMPEMHIRITWMDVSHDPQEDGFIIERKPFHGNDEWTEVGIVSQDYTTFVDTTDLHGLVEYTYRVGAYKE